MPSSNAALSLLVSTVREERIAAQPGPWDGNAVHALLSGFIPADNSPQVNWNTQASEPEVVLRRVRDAASHKIGGDAWYTAIVDWILTGMASVPGADSAAVEPLAVLAVAGPRLGRARRMACAHRDGHTSSLPPCNSPAAPTASRPLAS